MIYLLVGWLKKRLEAVMDYVVGGVVLIAVLALCSSIAVFGGRQISVEGWEVILVVSALTALVAGEVLLFRRLTSQSSPHQSESG